MAAGPRRPARTLVQSALMVRATRPALFLVLLAVAASGCGPRVDVKQALQVTDVSTGWFDAGIVDGKNKLVPHVSFRVKNTSGETVSSVQLNAVFRVVGDVQELGSMFVRGITTVRDLIFLIGSIVSPSEVLARVRDAALHGGSGGGQSFRGSSARGR